MSYGASVFRINFEKLLAVRRSDDTQLLAGLLRDNPADVDDFDEDDEEPSVSQALTTIINGGPVEDEFSPVWAIASLIIYDHFGVRLDANAITPSHPVILQFATKALQARADWLDQTQEVRDTIAMIDAWIEEAARHNEGIVCGYM